MTEDKKYLYTYRIYGYAQYVEVYCLQAYVDPFIMLRAKKELEEGDDPEKAARGLIDQVRRDDEIRSKHEEDEE